MEILIKLGNIFLKSTYVIVTLLSCLLMYAALSDYWGLIDFLVQPKTFILDDAVLEQFISNKSEITLPVYFDILYQAAIYNFQSISLSITQNISLSIINFIGWEFDTYITVFYSCILILCIVLLIKSERKSLHVSLLVIILSSYILGIILQKNHATRQEVVHAIKNAPKRLADDNGFMTLLKTGKYIKLNKQFQNYHDRVKSGELDDYDFAYQYDTLADHLNKDDVETLNDWVDKSENKLFAYLLRGSIYKNLGHEARGNKYISKTPKENLQLMQKYFDLAIADLEKVIELDPYTLYAHIHLYGISAFGDYKRDKTEIYKSAQELFGANYLLALKYVHFLQPRWGGSQSKTFNFVREQRNLSTDDPRLLGLSGLPLIFEGSDLTDGEDYNFEDSVKLYNLALLYSPRENLFLFLVGPYLENKQYTNLGNILETCIKYIPSSTSCLTYDVAEKNRLKNYGAAVISAKKIMRVWNLKTWQLVHAGFAFQMAADYSAAQEAYMRALDNEPLNMYALKNLYGMSAKKQTRDKVLIPYFEHVAIKLDSNPEVISMYASMLELYYPKRALLAFQHYLELADHEKDKASIEYAKNAIKTILKNETVKH